MKASAYSRPNYENRVKDLLMASEAEARSQWGSVKGFAASLERALRETMMAWPVWTAHPFMGRLTKMVLSASNQTFFSSILSPEEIIDSSSPEYLNKTEIWCGQRNRHPQLIIQPCTLAKLQETVKYLCDAPNIDFAIRSGGLGDSSASDVVVSMAKFDEFEFDAATDIVTIGAGQTWGDVDRKLEEHAPGYAILGARTPYVGVGGSIVLLDISWLSNEFGLGNDPQNLLDLHIVLPNGRALWASTEPDLLWALRGGGGNFGVVTAAKIQARKYPSTICASMIVFPDHNLPVVSKAVSDFSKKSSDPKLALHVFVMDIMQNGLRGEVPKPGIAFMIYDAHGEEHARSEAGFKWLFDLDGAVVVSPMTSMSIRQVNDLQANTRAYLGMNSLLSAPTTDTIDENFLIRCWDWWQKVFSADVNLGVGSYVLLEIMQAPAFSSAGGLDKTAWPHNEKRHILQLSTGFPAHSNSSLELAEKLLMEGPSDILQGYKAADFLPSFFQDFNDLSEIFGPNYTRLRQLKRKYDPAGRLNKGFFIPPAV
ncbi:cysteine desulfurase [Xylogone sp. PMI_703]|nr:cysteine desulfurase [Xylogone sp. PMI_703]